VHIFCLEMFLIGSAQYKLRHKVRRARARSEEIMTVDSYLQFLVDIKIEVRL
jgi:hypothetical protein